MISLKVTVCRTVCVYVVLVCFVGRVTDKNKFIKKQVWVNIDFVVGATVKCFSRTF